MEPFGQGNPKPRFLMRSVIITDINEKMHAKGHFKGTIRRQGAELSALLFKAKDTPLGDALFAAERRHARHQRVERPENGPGAD